MTESSDLRPFRIEVPQADLDDLHDRLARTRWPAELPGTGWERGVPVRYLRGLAEYWAEGFDWRAQEYALNDLPQFTTDIDGQRIHFLHVRSPEAGAQPLILTHGWPSSPVEFLRVIAPLTDPAHAFHVIIPSLPGYGFSTPMRETGWGNLFRVAQAWVELMSRLGYQRYAVQGTDVGAGVASLLGMIAPDRVVGVHLTGTAAAFPFGPPIDPGGLSPADRARAERFNWIQLDGLGYLHLQSTRPQTLAYSLCDSPVGQLAWIVERFREGPEPAQQPPHPAGDRAHRLTTVSIFWFTGAGASSAHATYEGMQAYREMAAGPPTGSRDDQSASSGPPTGYAVFAADDTIRSRTDPTGRVAHWSEFDRGGHFPAMETPDLLVSDVRAFFTDLR